MDEVWRPGSFTKNFSWGPADRGLRELHELIRQGFDSRAVNVPRAEFQRRVANSGRPVYIPLNFFLYNKIVHGVSYVVADELVFQAINFRHSSNFDKLALFAFNLSTVGRWKGAMDGQDKPALWAKSYISDRVVTDFRWNTASVTANDIEGYVTSDARYHAKTARKLATNLYYLYRQGHLKDFNTKKAERWWISALFLTLDRASEELFAQGKIPQDDRYEEYAIRLGFHQLSGPRSVERDLAAIHFIELYGACGGISRFSEAAALERQRILLTHIQYFANNPEPVGVFHSSNPRARGAIPRACAMLAQYIANFELIDIDDLDEFDVETFVKVRTQEALADLQRRGIRSDLTADEILSMTRDK